MSQTVEGAAKAIATIKDKYGVDADGKSLLHKRVGSIGGSKMGVTKGFAIGKNYELDDPRHPRNCGRKGGHISKRGKLAK